MCKYWTSPDNLGSVVSRSLVQLIKSTPAIGWVKADQMASEEATKEILRLRQQIDSLKKEIEHTRITAPKGSEQLAQGDDEFRLHLTIITDGKNFRHEFSTTWDKIFSYVAPSLMHECGERSLREILNNFIDAEIGKQISKDLTTDHKLKLRGFRIEENDFQTIKVQLRAIGLITMSQNRQRSVKDKETYWTLTPYGSEVMNRLRAIRRP